MRASGCLKAVGKLFTCVFSGQLTDLRNRV
jgi:hypothetical protein